MERNERIDNLVLGIRIRSQNIAEYAAAVFWQRPEQKYNPYGRGNYLIKQLLNEAEEMLPLLKQLAEEKSKIEEEEK